MFWVSILRVDGYYIIVLDAIFAVNFLMFLLLGVLGGIYRYIRSFYNFLTLLPENAVDFYIFKFLEFYVVA